MLYRSADGRKYDTTQDFPQGCKSFEMSVSKDAWPDGVVIRCGIDYTRDGKTWEEMCAFTTTGGETLDKFGNVATKCVMRTPLPPCSIRPWIEPQQRDIDTTVSTKS